MKHIKLFEGFNLMLEYMGKEMISLKDYFLEPLSKKKSRLPLEYPHLLKYFLKSFGVDSEEYSIYTLRLDDNLDIEDEDILAFKKDYPKLYSKFIEYIYDIFENGLFYDKDLSPQDLPTWFYFTGKPKIIKNQWMIHFTEYADDISKEGFTFGIANMDRLGLTTKMNYDKKEHGGYNFAFLVSDEKYARKSSKYGKKAVLFRASGIEIYHKFDREDQIIFYGNTAKNIIPLTASETPNGELQWTVKSKKTGKLIHADDAEKYKASIFQKELDGIDKELDNIPTDDVNYMKKYKALMKKRSSLMYRWGMYNSKHISKELQNVVNWIIKNYSQYRKHL